MIDIHCHLLPGIDDGPSSVEMSLELARQAVANGVSHAVITPHIHHGRWDNSLNGIKGALEKFRQVVRAESIPLTLGFAAEVRIGPELLTMLPAKQIPMMGFWNSHAVMLLEMPHSHFYVGTDKFVRWLLKHNVLPMIAHPERNKEVMNRLDKLQPLIDLGCLIQITAGSVIGQFGTKAQRCAEELLQMGVVTVIASDAHHPVRRPVNLAEGRDAVAAIVGEKQAKTMVYDNPLKIVGSQFLVRSERHGHSFGGMR